MSGSLNLAKAVRASAPATRKPREPQLTVDWKGRRDSLGSNLRAVFGGPKLPRNNANYLYLRDTWVRPHFPGRAFFASILWHAVLIFLPLPYWNSFLRATRVYEPLSPSHVNITYYAPIRDLPLVAPPAPTPAPPQANPPAEPSEPVAKRGAEVFHPRQTIISAPRVPTHPRQTLIQPDSTPEPPKILPQLPNIVKWANPAQPSKPHLTISREALAALRPKNPGPRAVGSLPVPELPNLERNPGELHIASDATSLKPRMPVEPISLPQVASRPSPGDAPAPSLPNLERQPGGVAVASNTARPLMPAEPIVVPRTGASASGVPGVAAPDLRPNGGGQRLIAISPSPSDAPANLPVPPGNLAARMTISPEGPQQGAPGGSPSGSAASSASAGGGSGGATPGPPGISISGGNPNSSVAGLGGSGRSAPASPPVPRVESHAVPDDPEPGHPSAATPAATPPDRVNSRAPEQIFGDKRIYTLHVNMPNLSSITGSWILRFVEIKPEDEFGRPIPVSGDVTGPVPVRKVDPRYPPAIIKARVEGEVVLYAVIRRDGSVDSIQLVKGIEAELDTNAMEAFARWRFRPAERNGRPVELEAIVHIPFRAIAPQD